MALLLTGCGNAQKRNKWQKQEDFIERRSIYYNNFVESGGMIKDDNTDQVSPVKRQIQQALNQGTTVTHIS